ncbi:uncharacterized protein LOC110883035 [Helianthus annuus]|uniref:uncharacterized protein LOC110883035 n=1 Tax=Helianthus annuus TaxID=4232 RepID=UPI000B9058B2|nr:uncharacterized protein LOC110883035 [Helianthus annuus]
MDGVVEDLGENGESDNESEPNIVKSYGKNTRPTTSEPIKAKEGESILPPFPEALKDPGNTKIINKRGPQPEEILEVFKQVKINLPLIDAIKQVPTYAKYLKDLCTQKRQHKVPKKVDLTDAVSAVLNGVLPPKLRDPGTPLISIQVGDFKMSRALLDLGASVSILPGSLYDQYDFGPLRRADTTVVLADLTPKLPRGIVRDVIVKVEEFFFPVDFLVLDYVSADKNNQPNVILGRSFLATTHAQIDCRTGTVYMTFGNKKVRLNVFSNVSDMFQSDECFMADIIDGCDPHVEDKMPECCLFCDWVEENHMCDLEEEVRKLEAQAVQERRPPWSHQVESLPAEISSGLKPSLISPPKVELKELPAHLKYAFLGEDQTLLVIIAANLEKEQEEALLKVLKTHRAAIGWTLADLKDAKPARDTQRRLNPNMREVVKKEVIKWLDHGIIYPISDSAWVSPTQTVPKKAGIQIVKGDNGEQIATRPVTGWREQLVQAPILQSPDWTNPFEIMCDASDFAIGVVLGQRVDKKPVVIYYASKTLSDAQLNYTTTEKELFAVVYALDKFRSYICGSKVIVYSDHSVVRYLMEKKDAKPRLIRWVLLLQEFDLEIRDKKGCENVVADHLSRLPVEVEEFTPEINEHFPDEFIMAVSSGPWYANFANYLVSGTIPDAWNKRRKQQFLSQVKNYIWDEPDLFRIGADQIIRRCVPETEFLEVLQHAHSSACGGHFSGQKTGHKVLEAGFIGQPCLKTRLSLLNIVRIVKRWVGFQKGMKC